MGLFQVLADSHRLDDDLSFREKQSGYSLYMVLSYAIGIDLAVLFALLLSLEEVDETEVMRDLFEVEQDADSPGGGTAKVGEKDQLVAVGLSLHVKICKIEYYIDKGID